MKKNIPKIKVLVTGANGQLAKCIYLTKDKSPVLDFCFVNSSQLDITRKEDVKSFFTKRSFDFLINCAAYTNVELAEKEPKKAMLVNAEGVKNLAHITELYDITLIHISTDYVFDGKKKTTYTEKDIPNPINEYGKSKLLGEQYIQETLTKYFIIRTSWLYSQFGKNFYRSILQKSEVDEKLRVTTSEKGTPTNANDLAKCILELISIKNRTYGLYHYSNLGEATWFDFAKEILEVSGKLGSIHLEKIDNYATFAERPKYSVLNKNKIKTVMELDIPTWKTSLKELALG